MKLFIASIFTLGLLFMMFLALVLTVLYSIGILSWYLLIGLTIVVNFIFWLVGPYFSDWIYQFFYKLKWIGIDGLEELNVDVAEFVREVCKKNKIKIPKIGYIDDDNPTSFTYGSDNWNARIVVTKGIFTYLKTNEIKTVFGHEVGHVVHRDFVVMAIASVIIQLFYEIYRIGVLGMSTKSGGGKKGGGGLAFLAMAIVGYVFYIIATYILLYLSRIREYYADEFSAQESHDPNGLSMALIKIAYGLIKNPDNPNQQHLLKSTRAYNIFDYKIARTIGLAYVDVSKSKSWKPVEGAILFDKFNPWAFISELSSTHPLTGKRIERLGMIAGTLRLKPLFNIPSLVKKYAVDKAKFYKNFGTDLFFLMLPYVLGFFAVGGILLMNLGSVFVDPLGTLIMLGLKLIGIFIGGLGLGFLLKTFYSYSMPREFAETTIEDLMGDIYTSPIRGKPNSLEGKIVGRGVPGLIFSEDMMFQDSTGLIYLNYESLFPFFGNIVFGFTKVKDLIGKKVKVEGWFVRSLTHLEELNIIKADGKVIKSRVRLLGIIMSLIFMAIGGVVFLLL